MSKFVTMLILLLLVITIACDDSGSADATGEGGPAKSPVNIAEDDDTVSIADTKAEDALVEVTEETLEEPEEEVKDEPVIEIDSSKGKWFKVTEKELASGEMQSGIAAYEDNQDLYAKITNIEKAGWYKISVIAKNYGTLPDFYQYFNMTVINETTGESLGGLFIKASDDRYQTGNVLAYLEKGATTINFLWVNEAYKEDKYDVNLQIKTISIEPATAPVEKKSLTRSAHEYSLVDGRFFWDDTSFFTYWSDQTIIYNFPGLEAGSYMITIYAKNKGVLPKASYKFEVKVSADGVESILTIPGSDKVYKHGNTMLDLTGGNIDLEVSWINDEYQEGSYDTNIQVEKIELKKVGKSKRSALAAYLLGISTTNKILIMSALICLIVVIAGITLWNKRRV